MKRKIIKIDETACNGCGLCAAACHEGAIGMINGKARLLREAHCDGLGDCLPACPAGAITFEEREAPAYSHKAGTVSQKKSAQPLPCGCPGTAVKPILHQSSTTAQQADAFSGLSELTNWPVQLRLVPVKAPYFSGAHLLIAADCTAYAFGAFHAHFLRGKTALIGCPKLDDDGQTEKLTAILRENNILSVTVVRMEVPCCGGLERAASQALAACGKAIPLQTEILSVDGCLQTK